MRVLLDAPAKKVILATKTYPFVSGQLMSPTTRRAYLGEDFAIDNGAFAGFSQVRFEGMLARQLEHRKRCFFVAAPDVVGSARRTLEAFEYWQPRLEGWPVALVAQDGQEHLPIPWDLVAGIFIGGTTDWKMSKGAADIVRTAKILGKHAHIGRVNTPARYKHFLDLGAETCDGSGLARFDWMLEKIARSEFDNTPLFNANNGADG
jgi:hypothetical protein